MIIRRQLYANNSNKLPMKKVHDSGMELKPIYKKVPQPTKLLNASSAGGGTNTIVRDVEDLLKPISQQKHHNDRDEMLQSQASKERTERNLWRNDEVMEMLYTMQQVKALEKLNDKTVKSENVFKDVEVIMHRNGYVKKSHVQIWTKWKFLKSTYMTSRRNRVIPRMVPPQIYEMIHKMITGLNQSINDSCSSVDGDNSSVSGMVISGVEGGVSDVGPANGDEDEDSFGMAHPIFGFRLGTVKSEPEDTGYEAVENNGSDRDPLEEELSSSKSDKPVKEEENISDPEQKTSNEPEPVQKEVPHRGRGRPPKNPPTATSTPKSTPSPATKPAQMPPLRVAPFAKAIHSTNAIAVPNRPPPPLTMPPTPRIRVANLSNLKNGEPVKFAQPKLIPKPAQHEQTPPVQPVRLTKDISMQSRSSSTPSPSYPKMKQIPMRKTPYSLRPDRAIPDLEASLSPPPPPIEKPSHRRLEEVPTTKHLIMQNNSNSNPQTNVNRKRRMEWQDPLPGKQIKFTNNTYEERNSSRATKLEDSQSYGKVLQNVMIDLSSSLRKMQTEMMRDFFNKQNELLEREHKFQMQQDQMIMKTFQEQTQQIMHSVKQLVSSIKTNRNEPSHVREEYLEKSRNNGKVRIQPKRQQEREEEMEMDLEEDHIQAHDDDDEHEVEDEDHDQEHEMEQDTEEMYTDNEEQQDHLEEHEENEQEEMENNADEEEEHEEDEDNEQSHDEDADEEEEEAEEGEDEDQSQSADDQHENGITAEEQDNSNDSTNAEQNPLHMVTSELNEH